MGSTVVLPQIVDGFSYNDQLLYLPGRYFPVALQEMDSLRRAANFRTREWCVPDNFNSPIQPFDTFYYQIEVAGGSYFWGYNFAAISATDPDGSPVATTATDLLVQLTDSCTGVPLWQDYANAGAAKSSGNARCFPILVSPPRLIIDPGLVNVEIANRTANSIVCQFRLRFAESCRLIDETEREHAWKVNAGSK